LGIEIDIFYLLSMGLSQSYDPGGRLGRLNQVFFLFFS
jgi:hypothetical protein